ncbi:glutathione S-transferase omega-1-like [Leptodactylus fuscus]|uniref:glutathione S-transferase omega-1-like n=1 Tax=Leptodactylus fuscus TaxID=238119 RepID=UPI003F4E7AF2
MTGSQRSLAKGSAAPGPVPEGSIRLYGMRFCPFVQRVELVLVAKGIKYEVVNINIKSKPDWFFEKSPFGLVPSLETSDGKIIFDSPIICDYLDEAFPGKKLTPADPYEIAQQKMLLEHFSKFTPKVLSIVFARHKKEDYTQLKAESFKTFQILEEALTNKPYFGGESLSMIDYMIWPWCERLHIIDGTDFLEKLPRVNAWSKLMLQDPVVKETLIEPDIVTGFLRLFVEGSLEATDYGLN